MQIIKNTTVENINNLLVGFSIILNIEYAKTPGAIIPKCEFSVKINSKKDNLNSAIFFIERLFM